jgi:hypothetical protein
LATRTPTVRGVRPVPVLMLPGTAVGAVKRLMPLTMDGATEGATVGATESGGGGRGGPRWGAAEK